ncbi:hypothetical protein HK100_005202 [Physocladia obscura]|uniref:Major facilitator superfamily (MFS) profile domain-containing protein n=1 Tax=Physocladia obscura TaxID=109957 RepID=A0AAD5SXL0_9FUNG|nr:hypothetical protein HK100_005202 [Physocladia obscura]
MGFGRTTMATIALGSFLLAAAVVLGATAIMWDAHASSAPNINISIHSAPHTASPAAANFAASNTKDLSSVVAVMAAAFVVVLKAAAIVDMLLYLILFNALRLSEPYLGKLPAVPALHLRKIALVLVCVMPEVLIYHLLHPLYPYMVKTLIPDDSAIGYHTGLLQSAYFLPSVVSAPAFGYLSDVLGRRKMLLFGLVGYGLGTLALGLSLRYWHAVLAMIATGFFSGNATVAKSMIGEMTADDHTRALGYSAYGVAYALFSILGAIVGASIADLRIFTGVSFFAERKYFAASFFGFILTIACLVFTRILLEDEVPSLRNSSYVSLKSAEEPYSDSTLPKIRLLPQTQKNLTLPSTSFLENFYLKASPYLALLNRHTLTPLLLYTLYALTNSLLHTAIPLISASDKGYALPQKRTAQISMYAAAAKLCAKTAFMGVHSVFGTLNTYRLGTSILIPAIVLVSGITEFGFNTAGGTGGLIPGLVIIGVGESWIYLSLVMLITEGGQAHDQGKNALGLIHGVSGCLAAVVRTVGPTVAGALWEMSEIWLILFDFEHNRLESDWMHTTALSNKPLFEKIQKPFVEK